MRLGRIAVDEIRGALAGIVGAGRHTMARELSARFGVSAGHIYRVAGPEQTRAARSDRGKKKIELPDGVDDFMYGLTSNADLNAAHVLWITARHFGLSADFMSAGTYRRWLRRERFSRAELKMDLRPYRRFEAAYANQLHHYDTTVAEAFYANDDDSIGREEKHQRYKNKPGNKKPRLILYSLVDDYSRVIFARFYFSENAPNLLDFVFHAWSQKDDRRFPFYGIPENFYCDQGSPRRSELFKNAQVKLGFNIPNTTPAHSTEFGSRKHGKVERTFGEGLLGEFMKITKVFRFTNLDELNACLWDWLIWINNKKVSTTGKVRFARWMESATAPRCMPSEEMFALLCYDHTRRTVTRDLKISLNGKQFQLPYKKPFINWVEVKVEIYWQRGHEDTIRVVYDHHDEELHAIASVVDIALEYKSVARTDREERLEKLKAQNYSTVNFPQMYAPEKDLSYLPRKGERFDERRIAEKTMPVETASGETSKWRPSLAPERWLGYVRAARQLQEEDFLSRPLSGADAQWLKSLFNGREQISETELDDAKILAKGDEKTSATSEGS